MFVTYLLCRDFRFVNKDDVVQLNYIVMVNVDVVSLLLLQCIGAGDRILSVDVCDPQHVYSVIEADVERLGLTLLNSWIEDGRETVYAYADASGIIYQFRLIDHSVLVNN